MTVQGVKRSLLKFERNIGVMSMGTKAMETSTMIMSHPKRGGGSVEPGLVA